MTIAATNLTAGVGTSDPQSTASVAPTAGSVVFVAVSVARSSLSPTDVMTVSGLGLTWTKVTTVAYGARRRLWLFAGTGTASSGTISLDYGGDGTVQEIGWCVDEATGLDGTTPYEGPGTGSGSATSGTATATTTPDAGDATYSTLGLENDTDASVEAGWTQLGQTTGGSLGVRRVETGWDADADTSHTWTWSGTASWGAATLVLNAGAGGATDLTVQEAGHAHTADSPTLTQVHNLTAADATHAHAADSPTLTQVHNLTVAGDTLAHSADSPTLTQTHVLTVADATHSHTADSPTLNVATVLEVADAPHAHTADSPSLTQTHVLTVADATLAHTADTPSLTQLHVLTVAGDTLAHSVDNVTVTSVGDTVNATSTVTVTAGTTSTATVTAGSAATAYDTIVGYTGDTPYDGGAAATSASTVAAAATSTPATSDG